MSVVCFLIAATQNYIINHLWSFRQYTANTPPSVRKWLDYIASSLVGLAINIFVMKSILMAFHIPYKFIAQACGIAAGMLVNFVISKLVVFGNKISTEK
jgi:putative flippase GtrA